MSPQEKVVVDFAACRLCGACVSVCPGGARTICGQRYTPEELYREAAKDAAFYRKGGGGVTLSGGEVLLQWEVAAETLRLCRSNYLNTCLETTAFAPWEHLWAVAQHCHTVFVDIKHMDSACHKKMTGAPNEQILDHIQRLCQELPRRGGKVILRLPLVPGYNDGEEEVVAAAEFAGTLEGKPEINLLPYHDLGQSKYEMIGRQYLLSGLECRTNRDSYLTSLQALCRRVAPDNRVSIGGDAIALD